MRRKVFFSGGALLWAVLAILLSPASAQTLLNPPRTGDVGQLLWEGQRLETDRRWGDALTHYENAVRQFPEDRILERRFELARLHYDLGRRYGDQSFRDTLAQLSVSEALDLYRDVLLKIQAHYVEPPNWKDLVEFGINSLEVAFSEPAFLERNLPGAGQGAIAEFQQELRRRLGPRPLAARSDACDAVADAARLAQMRLIAAPTAVVLEFMCGATNALDPYSAYLTPGQLAEVYSQIEGNFVGLGIELKAHDGALLIVRVIPRSPAQQHGIRAGDRIIAVGDQLTSNVSTDQAANLLQGEIGSTVDLTVATPGQEPRQLTIRRQRIDVPSIDEARIIDANQGIAYLKLACFQKNTCRDLDAALWKLHRDGMKSLVIDLRGNPGGLLVTAVEVVDRFVDRGLIVSTRGRNAQEDFSYSAHEDGTWRVPLVLVIDQDSASAAEIFAGAVRDHHRGTIVGVRSFGKGSVQGIFPLSLTNAGVRLTTARFYSPSGRPYTRVGVEPDILVHQAAKPSTATGAAPATNDDPMLAAALQVAGRIGHSR